MRRAAAGAARALAALMLAAAGCDAVSSLTPFGLGWTEPESAAQNASGLWSGTTSTGGAVTFQVGNSEVVDFTLSNDPSGCLADITASEPAPIDANGAFSLDVTLDQGRFVASGRFTSSTTCSGSYSFEFFSVAGGTCPRTGSGTFTATKTP